MIYMIAFLAGALLLAIRPTLGYYRYKKLYEDLRRQHTAEKNELLQKQHALSDQLRRSLEKIRELRAMIDQPPPSLPAPSLSIPELRRAIWGDFFAEYGHSFATTTPEQQKLIHYPSLNPDSVYFTPAGKSYHSVRYCYTLDASREILSGPLQAAKDRRLHPCSKCVSPDDQ